MIIIVKYDNGNDMKIIFIYVKKSNLNFIVLYDNKTNL